MTSPRVFGVALVVGVCLLSAGPRAQSREQVQVMADLRILQEQAQQLRLAVGQLGDQLKQLATTLTEQAGTTTKQTADSLTLVRDMQRTIDALGQQVSANNLQVMRFKDELESLRQGQALLQQQQSQMFQQLLTMSSITPQTDPGSRPATPTTPASQTTTTPPPPPPDALPSSPEALFHGANSQYILQQYPLAISGFEELIQKHPQSTWAPEAQFLIGMSYANQGKYRDAVMAFAVVIDKYPTSDKLPGSVLPAGRRVRAVEAA